MILNKRNLLLLTLVVMTSACSSLPSLPSFSSDGAKPDQASDAANTEQQTQDANADSPSLEGDEATVATLALTPKELEEQALAAKARNLMGTLNAFKVDKEQEKKLNSSQLGNVQSAMTSLVNGDADQALVTLQQVIDDPDFIAAPTSAVWVLRGDINRALEQKDKAVDDYLKALSLSANNYQAHNRLGFIYRDQGKFDMAKTHYEQAIKAWPGNARSYRNRGILFDLYLGDKTAALDDYKIYKALLDFQIQSVDTPAKSLVKEQKLIRQWILDIQRQINALQREQANG